MNDVIDASVAAKWRAILGFFETDRPRLIESTLLAACALELALRLDHQPSGFF